MLMHNSSLLKENESNLLECIVYTFVIIETMYMYYEVVDTACNMRKMCNNE